MIYIKLLLTAAFWGGTFIAGRTVSQRMSPFSIAFLRFALASLLLLAVVRKTEGRLPRISGRAMLQVLLLGMTGVFAYNALFFRGLSLIEASRASLIIATCPVFITLASTLFTTERIAATTIPGVLVSVIGAAIVISRGDVRGIVAGGIGWGEICIFGCVFSWVVYSLIGKSVMTELAPVTAVAYSAAIGAAALAVPALAEGLIRQAIGATTRDWLSIVYLAVFGTVVGFVWYYDAVRRIGTVRAGLFINFVPVSALLLAFLILHEPITASLLLGGSLVIGGVVLTNRSGNRAVISGRDAGCPPASLT